MLKPALAEASILSRTFSAEHQFTFFGDLSIVIVLLARYVVDLLSPVTNIALYERIITILMSRTSHNNYYGNDNRDYSDDDESKHGSPFVIYRNSNTCQPK